MRFEDILIKFENVRGPRHRRIARCPAHDDRTNSLSISYDMDGRKTLLCCHAECSTDTVCATVGLKMSDLFDSDLPEFESSSNVDKFKVITAYPYRDEKGIVLYENCRLHPFADEPKPFRQRQFKNGKAVWGLRGARRVPYRLPELIEGIKSGVREVFLVEGEKDCDNLRDLGFTATNLKNWKKEFNSFLRGLNLTILCDHDTPGYKIASDLRKTIGDTAASVKIIDLYDAEPVTAKGGKDVSDWIEEQRCAGLDNDTIADELSGIIEAASGLKQDHCNKFENLPASQLVTLDDFYAYSPTHSYIHIPTGEMWSATAVNSRIPKIDRWTTAARFLDKNRAVEQMTWAPGEPIIIKDRFISKGGCNRHKGARCFNLYKAPPDHRGNRNEIRPWLDLIQALYPDEADHLIAWFAYRVQRPDVKINHALVLGGGQGIGKDSILEPVKFAVGHWNFCEAGPHQILGRFNGFLRSVVLRISEARDLGDIDRFAFYERMKTLAAAPPDVLMVDEKNLREYSIPNLTGIIITTNHMDSIHLPADDRRHFIAWSEKNRGEFTADYWQNYYQWLERHGRRNVAKYLRTYDISSFDPKRPPLRTTAWQQIVDSGRAPEDAEIADLLDALGNPNAVTLSLLTHQAQGSPFAAWLEDRRNRRKVPHRLNNAGYVPIRNEAAKDGLWKIRGNRQVVYARRELTLLERIQAVQGVV